MGMENRAPSADELKAMEAIVATASARRQLRLLHRRCSTCPARFPTSMKSSPSPKSPPASVGSTRHTCARRASAFLKASDRHPHRRTGQDPVILATHKAVGKPMSSARRKEPRRRRCRPRPRPRCDHGPISLHRDGAAGLRVLIPSWAVAGDAAGSFWSLRRAPEGPDPQRAQIEKRNRLQHPQ